MSTLVTQELIDRLKRMSDEVLLKYSPADQIARVTSNTMLEAATALQSILDTPQTKEESKS